ncbi:hypothetical protein GF318_01540 [Candidatus Micrarchaeota archaeon]|nr:hypothetical protein [Candidatus Micrarchaeota archaeon]
MKDKDKFEISSGWIALATIVILLGIMVYSGITFQPELENPQITYGEAPLEKNTGLQIKPGEEYVYAYDLGNSSVNITYLVSSGNNCTAVRLLENTNLSSVCLNEEGNGPSGSNVSLGDSATLFFKPWMLALDSNWKWNVSMYMSFQETREIVSELNYRVMRTDRYRGRPCFVVEIETAEGSKEYNWVDKEKRVLLKTSGETYDIELVKGLPLD